MALSLRYPDHHAYTEHDINAIRSLLRVHAIDTVITTEKDMVKLRELRSVANDVRVATLALELVGESTGDDIFGAITKKPRAMPAAS